MQATIEKEASKLIKECVWLNSILELTKYKEYVPLTCALLEKIKHLPGIINADIFEVYESEQQTVETSVLINVSNILTKPIPANERIRVLLKNKELIASDNPEHCDIKQTVFPVRCSNTIERILMLDYSSMSHTVWEQVLTALKTYANLLNLIDEKDRDRLTGLLNRYTFENNISKFCTTSKQQSLESRGREGSSWIAMLDIDHFKRVNDIYGHIMGDEVLIIFSRLMISSFRYSDIAFRFGGEEFTVILTGCDQDGVEKALERFRATVESYLFPQVGQITVSVGYELLDDSQPPNLKLENADLALYHAKENGRNRVVAYSNISNNDEHATPLGSVELF